MNKVKLRGLIETSLLKQGFEMMNGSLIAPTSDDKIQLQIFHAYAVAHKKETAKKSLLVHQERLLKRFANGSEISPLMIAPKLVEVKSGSEDELLFRYATLLWSIPISSGYGRRLRFLVIDEQNEKLIGIIGLADPVFSQKARDDYIGWTHEMRREKLRYVMDAFVLGAVAPYSALICGKLVAMLAASDEVRERFFSKYRKTTSRINEIPSGNRLACMTTTSALGRSSLYNRIKLDDQILFQRAGYTTGYGEFHFSNGVYGAMTDYANRYCIPTDRKEEWGEGFRNRREVIQKCLRKIGMSTELLKHGVRREVFVVPLAANAFEFLRGEHKRLLWHNFDVDKITKQFTERWLTNRLERYDLVKSWSRENLKIWK
jgi:hypothetical protein